MKFRLRKVLESIFDRLAEPGTETNATFLFDEIKRWPSNAVEDLLTAGILNETSLADTIICNGCEERCHRPVKLVEATGDRARSALSDCHIFANMGSFEHSLKRLKRWITMRELVAKFVTRKLGLALKDRDDRWRRIRYTTLEIQGIRRAFSLEFAGSAQIIIGALEIPLITLIDWDGDGIKIDRDTLIACVEASLDLQSGNKRTQPSTNVRKDSKAFTKIRNRRLQRRLEALAPQHPKLKKERLCQRIEKSGEFPGITGSTIARITRMTEKK